MSIKLTLQQFMNDLNNLNPISKPNTSFTLGIYKSIYYIVDSETQQIHEIIIYSERT